MPATSAEQMTALAGTTVIVHPLVLLSVTDHHTRVAARTKKRVVGVLLGQDNGKTINVANSFAVPFEEDEKDSRTWFLDHDFIEGMFSMFKKVNAKERMIGWYHTGPKLRSSDMEINSLFKKYIARPVMVIINVRDTESVNIPTDCYFAVEEIKDDGTATVKTFLHVPSAIEAEEAEEIGVEHLLRDIKDSTTTTLTTRISAQLAALKGLHSRLDEIRQYLVAVAEGKYPINHGLLYSLQDALTLLPDLDDPLVTRGFTTTTNDELLVVYLCSLVRSVVALHNLIDNKAALGQMEMEEVEAKEKGEKPDGPKVEAKEGEKEDKEGEKEKETESKGL